jgi:hypothetical protein
MPRTVLLEQTQFVMSLALTEKDKVKAISQFPFSSRLLGDDALLA